MAGWTNKGKFSILDAWCKNTGAPTSFYVALVTTTPDADTNTMGDLTECAAGNGYTSGGIQVTRDATGFDTITEDDDDDKGLVQIKDLVWTASGGTIPASGDDPTYAVLTDDNATVASREVYAFASLGGATSIGDGATLTISDFELDLTES